MSALPKIATSSSYILRLIFRFPRNGESRRMSSSTIVLAMLFNGYLAYLVFRARSQIRRFGPAMIGAVACSLATVVFGQFGRSAFFGAVYFGRCCWIFHACLRAVDPPRTLMASRRLNRHQRKLPRLFMM